jgi:lambda repressor-like predicted transcriptional regulator
MALYGADARLVAHEWTDKSHTIQASFGPRGTSDPLTLAAIAKEANLKALVNLLQVDFYKGAHLIELALDAYILDIWQSVGLISLRDGVPDLLAQP